MSYRALVRRVPDSFARSLRPDDGAPAPDPGGARVEHAGYVAALEAAGYRVRSLPADEAHPDCPFVEDVAVIIGDVALVTRPGAPSRRGEAGPVAAALAADFPVESMAAPATLDGGDVLQVGARVFVGRSARTNDAGISRLAELAGGVEVVPVDVAGPVLHLKSAVDGLAADTVLVQPGFVDESVFGGLRILHTAPGEAGGANVLPLPGGRILVADHCPETARVLATAGFEPALLAAREFARADGGLTCLSIRWQREP